MTDDPATPDELPGMTGTPPSQRPAIPEDDSQHAVQSAREWEDVCESYVQMRMRELGIAEERIGVIDYAGDGQRHAFDPDGRAGGTCDHFQRLYVDSGFLNPELLAYLGGEAAMKWTRMSARRRIDSIVSHEDEETRGDHETAIQRAAETHLPIDDESRHLLRLIWEAAAGKKKRER